MKAVVLPTLFSCLSHPLTIRPPPLVAEADNVTEKSKGNRLALSPVLHGVFFDGHNASDGIPHVRVTVHSVGDDPDLSTGRVEVTLDVRFNLQDVKSLLALGIHMKAAARLAPTPRDPVRYLVPVYIRVGDLDVFRDCIAWKADRVRELCGLDE
jgi:hypothetical protein